MTVAGVPVNLPTGAHAHGYADVSFLIPELVSGVQFRKGPHFADEGDFSAAGVANVNYVNRLEGPHVGQTTAGVYAQTQIEWARTIRTTLGLRDDLYRFGVRSDHPFNSGSGSAGLVSPKIGAMLGPWAGTSEVERSCMIQAKITRLGWSVVTIRLLVARGGIWT